MISENKIKKSKSIVCNVGSLYHDFSFFGLKNIQKSGIYIVNQKAKAPILTSYIALSIAKCMEETKQITFTELFCADCYYSMIASRLGCSKCIAIGKDRKNIKKAKVVAKEIEMSNIEYKHMVIDPETKLESTDIVMNTGGLYHVDDPEGVLKMSYDLAKKYLIVQSVVTLETEDEDYFEHPAPGFDHGNRMSRQFFDKIVRRNCPNIVDSHFNTLESNPIDSKGSCYYLIKK